MRLRDNFIQVGSVDRVSIKEGRAFVAPSVIKGIQVIPYEVIRRWSLGDSDPICKNERAVRAVHTPRALGTPVLILVVTFALLEAQTPLWLIAICTATGLSVAAVTTFFALRMVYPIPFISATYAVDAMLLTFPIAATSFSPALTAIGLTMLLTNGIYTSGPKIGILLMGAGLLTLGGFYLLLDGPAQDHQLSPLTNFLIISSGLIYFGFQSVMGHRTFKALKEQRKKVQHLNKQIKEQVLVRYLPPALINDIFDGKVSMDTKPATQDITVLFSDLSGFTKMSEEQGAETVADFLNDYLSIMNETIFANNGTIDKFIGDAIMVLFGAPVPMTAKEQATNAARCARAMQAGMVLVNEKWKARGLNEVSMRIGIHQGTAVVGNFGSAQRVDYTAIGPSVNLASRIESACVPGEIFVSPEISELLSPELTEQAGEYELKGISGKTSLYRLVGTVSS